MKLIRGTKETNGTGRGEEEEWKGREEEWEGRVEEWRVVE